MSPTNMKFEIPFDEEIYNHQTNLIFKDAWKVKTKLTIFRTLMGLFALGMGFLTYPTGGINMILFFSVATYFLLNAGNFLQLYFHNKKVYKKEVDNMRQSYASNNLVVWEFDDDFFRYQDVNMETKCTWEFMKSYKIIDENILLLAKPNNAGFMIGKKELGTENYEQLLSLLSIKLDK